MNPKNSRKKSSNHENITCNFRDGDIRRLGVGYLTHAIDRYIDRYSWIIVRLLIQRHWCPTLFRCVCVIYFDVIRFDVRRACLDICLHLCCLVWSQKKMNEDQIQVISDQFMSKAVRHYIVSPADMSLFRTDHGIYLCNLFSIRCCRVT